MILSKAKNLELINVAVEEAPREIWVQVDEFKDQQYNSEVIENCLLHYGTIAEGFGNIII